ncbi:MAG: hypothetical protein WDO71_12285 [Bacteroidota bacterium]
MVHLDQVLRKNRAAETTFVPLPYTFVNFGANAPNDNFYGLANRTSANGSTNPNIAYPNAARVFGVWDIIGDHTGAAIPSQGNPPTNTGYAVIINASYQTNRAFTQNITGLCEETYYEVLGLVQEYMPALWLRFQRKRSWADWLYTQPRQ